MVTRQEDACLALPGFPEKAAVKPRWGEERTDLSKLTGKYKLMLIEKS